MTATAVPRPRIDADEILDRDELNGTLDEVADRLWRPERIRDVFGPDAEQVALPGGAR